MPVPPHSPDGRQSVAPAVRRTRLTRQRQVILEVLRGTANHPSVDQIHAWVRQKLPRISLATVYRNLEALCARGEIQTIAWAGALKRFDGATHNHYHILCSRCGRLDDLPLPVDEVLDAQASCATDFKVTGHRLEFAGVCPACRRGAATTPAAPIEPAARPGGAPLAGDDPAIGLPRPTR